MSMRVTYKLISAYKKKTIIERNHTACFADLYAYCNAHKPKKVRYDRVEVLMKCSVANVPYRSFWQKLITKIDNDVKFRVINDDVYAIIPYKSCLRLKIITTILRFLWEDDNHYEVIVRITAEIYKKYPNIDPLIAVTIASSMLKRASGWGHALVPGAAVDLSKHVEDYRLLKNSTITIHNWFNSSFIDASKTHRNIIDKMDGELDINPALEYYNVSKNYNKLKYTYGSTGLNRRIPRNGKKP